MKYADWVLKLRSYLRVVDQRYQLEPTTTEASSKQRLNATLSSEASCLSTQMYYIFVMTMYAPTSFCILIFCNFFCRFSFHFFSDFFCSSDFFFSAEYFFSAEDFFLRRGFFFSAEVFSPQMVFFSPQMVFFLRRVFFFLRGGFFSPQRFFFLRRGFCFSAEVFSFSAEVFFSPQRFFFFSGFCFSAEVFVSPQMFFVSAKDFFSPQRLFFSPQRFFFSPQRFFFSPQRFLFLRRGFCFSAEVFVPPQRFFFSPQRFFFLRRGFCFSAEVFVSPQRFLFLPRFFFLRRFFFSPQIFFFSTDFFFSADLFHRRFFLRRLCLFAIVLQFVCFFDYDSTCDDGRTRTENSLQHSQQQQQKGWRSVPYAILLGRRRAHWWGPGKDTLGTPVPTKWGGRGWPAQADQPVTHTVRDGHRTRYTANMEAEQCRSKARALMTSADCCKKLNDEGRRDDPRGRRRRSGLENPDECDARLIVRAMKERCV